MLVISGFPIHGVPHNASQQRLPFGNDHRLTLWNPRKLHHSMPWMSWIVPIGVLRGTEDPWKMGKSWEIIWEHPGTSLENPGFGDCFSYENDDFPHLHA
jgi:hypothetical protein